VPTGESPVDVDRLHFTAELHEDERARIASFQADLPIDGIRLVKSFEVSRDGYQVVMTARLVGPSAATLMARHRLALELRAGRGLFPPPAAGFAAMLERMSRVVIADGAVHTLNDSRASTTLGPGQWTGFRSRFWAMLVRSDGSEALEVEPGASAPL